MSNPVLPPKKSGTCNPYRDTHVRPQKVTVLSKFIEVEKVKQDEKAEELVSIKRARENPEEVMKQR